MAYGMPQRQIVDSTPAKHLRGLLWEILKGVSIGKVFPIA
jgi:hypothetical protein